MRSATRRRWTHRPPRARGGSAGRFPRRRPGEGRRRRGTNRRAVVVVFLDKGCHRVEGDDERIDGAESHRRFEVRLDVPPARAQVPRNCSCATGSPTPSPTDPRAKLATEHSAVPRCPDAWRDWLSSSHPACPGFPFLHRRVPRPRRRHASMRRETTTVPAGDAPVFTRQPTATRSSIDRAYLETLFEPAYRSRRCGVPLPRTSRHALCATSGRSGRSWFRDWWHAARRWRSRRAPRRAEDGAARSVAASFVDAFARRVQRRVRRVRGTKALLKVGAGGYSEYVARVFESSKRSPRDRDRDLDRASTGTASDRAPGASPSPPVSV